MAGRDRQIEKFLLTGLFFVWEKYGRKKDHFKSG